MGLLFTALHVLYENCDVVHYRDVIMGVTASQITSLTIVFSTVYSDADQRKHQSSASLVFVRGTHRRPSNSPHKWPVRREMFHLMTSSWFLYQFKRNWEAGISDVNIRQDHLILLKSTLLEICTMYIYIYIYTYIVAKFTTQVHGPLSVKTLNVNQITTASHITVTP